MHERHATDAARVLVISGSTRTGSYNTTLAKLATERLVACGVDAEFVDLREHRLPLFDPDLEAAEGQPQAAHDLVELLRPANGLVIATPEYNGAMPPVLKNTVDWMSRVDLTAFFGKKVALLSATPGRRGGANVLAIMQMWLSYLGMSVHADTFGLPSVRHVLVDGALLDDHDARLDEFVAGYVAVLDATE
jgi:chromate reductase, NAD(P)H dehydrogenase (quinone)